MTATTIAGCFSLAAFAVAVLAGLAGGNHASSILLRAIVALVVCYPVGLGVGLIAQRLVAEHIEVHRRANPTPDGDEDDEPAPAPATTANANADEEVLVV